jgi:hypothetical protein
MDNHSSLVCNKNDPTEPTTEESNGPHYGNFPEPNRASGCIGSSAAKLDPD